MPSLCVTGVTGKLGGATFDALLSYNLISPSELVICTSSSPDLPRWNDLKAQGVTVRYSNYNEPASMETAFAGCTKLFLVSSTHINMDFGDADAEGREKHHIAAVRAARKAGIQHIYYTSLAFADASRSRVMTAHNRTEAFLAAEFPDGQGYTVIREGLYNESWPLYFGHYEPGKDERREILVAGDGPISWVAIEDLGLATAMILVDEVHKWTGKTVVLASEITHDLSDVARMVSANRGYDVVLKLVSREQYERYYIEQRGLDEGLIKWWVKTYDALPMNECWYRDSTLKDLLAIQGKGVKPMENTVKQMLDQ